MHPSSRDDFELPNLDFLGDEAELRAQALAKLDAMGGRPQPRDRYKGADETSSVHVSVDAKGFVVDVDIRRDWASSLAVESLAGAIFAAYQASVRELLEFAALCELADEEQKLRRAAERRQAERDVAWRGGQLPPEPDEANATAAYQEPPAGEEEFHNWVWDSLYAIGDKMHRVEQKERLLAELPDDRTVTGPYGYFKLRHRGDAILTITGDPGRIRMAEPQQLRTEALDVFRTAQHGHD